MVPIMFANSLWLISCFILLACTPDQKEPEARPPSEYHPFKVSHRVRVDCAVLGYGGYSPGRPGCKYVRARSRRQPVHVRLQ